MKILPFPVLVSAFALTAAVTAQTPPRCGTPDRDALMPESFVPSDCSAGSTNPAAQYAPTFIYRVPVVFHIIQRTSGEGALTEQTVRDQIEILNEDFRALPGTNGANGADAMIEFYLATEDPQGNPTTGITRSVDNTWFRDRGQYYNTLAWDTNRYLNIYSNNGGGALGYVPNLPQTSSSLVGSPNDRVVVLWDTVGRNAPNAPYDQGRTVTHEVGHYLGLFHTFSGGCSGSNCYSSGDLICDTNAEDRPNYGCPTNPQSCGTLDPFDNYMDYTTDLCMQRFTPEQVRRMRCTLANYRVNLASQCVVASATPRNAAGNAQDLTTVPPEIGATWTSTVAISTPGHNFAILAGYGLPASIPQPGGFTLLVDVTDPAGPLFNVGPLVGPIATFNLNVPNDPNFCGLAFTVQGATYGTTNFALTNAYDAIIGY